MLDVIKEYLVSLGFQTDNASFNQAQKAIDNVDKTVSKFANGSIKNFASAGTALTTFLVAANVGIAKYMSGLAKADLENEKFAKRMWMSKDNAVAYKNTMSALGSDLQDLYLSPELLQRYNKLRQQAGEMAAPKEYAQQMKEIRDIIFEFQRLKLEATYAMQWIGYYLFKYLEGPIGNVKKSLQDLNDRITKTMPKWTEKIAQVLSWIVRLGSAAVWGVKSIKEAFDSLAPATKTAGLAIAGFLGVLSMGPVGWLIAGLTALLLLMDDYKTYQEGGISYFGTGWENINNFKKSLEDNGTLKSFKTSLDGIVTSLGNILDSAGKIADEISTALGFENFADLLNQVVLIALDKLKLVLEGIAGALETIDGILSLDTDKMVEGLNKLANSLNPFSGLGIADEDSPAMKAANNLAEKQFGSRDKNAGEKTVKEMKKTAEALESWRRNVLSSLNNWVGGLFGKSNSDQESVIRNGMIISKHANGGIQTSPHLGWVAEEYPESIIPLDPNKRQHSLNLLAQTAGILGAPVTNSTANTVNNYYYVTNEPKYNIHGSEPMATAKAINQTVDYGLLTRNFREDY